MRPRRGRNDSAAAAQVVEQRSHERVQELLVVVEDERPRATRFRTSGSLVRVTGAPRATATMSAIDRPSPRMVTVCVVGL